MKSLENSCASCWRAASRSQTLEERVWVDVPEIVIIIIDQSEDVAETIIYQSDNVAEIIIDQSPVIDQSENVPKVVIDQY